MSSDINQNVRVTFITHGANVLTTLGQINGRLTDIGNTGTRTSRELGQVDKTLRAIGTTLRYSFAGLATYGIVGLTAQFSQFRQELGLIGAAAGQSLNRGGLLQMGADLRNMSNDLAVPLTQLEKTVTNVYSTLQNPDPSQVKNVTQWTSILARTIDADAQDVSSSLLGIRNAYNVNLSEIGNLASGFFAVWQRSSGMTGREWANLAGRVIPRGAAAGFSLPEVQALATTVTRTGGTAAINQRGLEQFLREMRQPQTAESERAWASIGLPLRTRVNTPGMTVVRRIMEELDKRGGINVNEDIFGATPEGEHMNLGGGDAPAWLGQLITRAEGQRALLALFMNRNKRGDIPSLDEEVKAQQRLTGSTEELSTAYEQFLDLNPILRQQIAWQNFGTAFVDAMNPVLETFAELSEKAAEWGGENPRRVQVAIAGGAALYAAGRIARRSERVGEILRKVPGGSILKAGALRTAGAAVVAPQILEQAASGTHPGSFQNPMWVLIHPSNPLLGSNVGGGGGPAVTGGKGRIPAWAKYGLPIGATAATLSLPLIDTAVSNQIMKSEIAKGNARVIPGGHPLLDSFRSKRTRFSGISMPDKEQNEGQKKIISSFINGYINADVAEARLRALEIMAGKTNQKGMSPEVVAALSVALSRVFAPGANGKSPFSFSADGTLELDVSLIDKGKVVAKKKAHIPTKAFPVTAPQSGGKNKTRRSGR